MVCRYDHADVEAARQETALANRTYGPVTPAEVHATFVHDHPWVIARS
jgi:hypothetical protein